MTGSDLESISPFFRASADRQNGVIRLALSGELELATVHVLQDTVRSLDWQGDGLLLDLGGLTFIDSGGLREVVGAVGRAARESLRLEVVGGEQRREEVVRDHRARGRPRRIRIPCHDGTLFQRGYATCLTGVPDIELTALSSGRVLHVGR
jgi:anti-anti-sigma factor